MRFGQSSCGLRIENEVFKEEIKIRKRGVPNVKERDLAYVDRLAPVRLGASSRHTIIHGCRLHGAPDVSVAPFVQITPFGHSLPTFLFASDASGKANFLSTETHSWFRRRSRRCVMVFLADKIISVRQAFPRDTEINQENNTLIIDRNGPQTLSVITHPAQIAQGQVVCVKVSWLLAHFGVVGAIKVCGCP